MNNEQIISKMSIAANSIAGCIPFIEKELGKEREDLWKLVSKIDEAIKELENE